MYRGSELSSEEKAHSDSPKRAERRQSTLAQRKYAHTPRAQRSVTDAMADDASRRALLGIPSGVFATWHDPHAEVRSRATRPLTRDSRCLLSLRLVSIPLFLDSSADAFAFVRPRRTSRTGAWPRPTA
jgi:hypothetical protein